MIVKMDAEQRAHLERENRFRAARGLPLKGPNDDKKDAAATRPKNEEDVWLTEAAHVLADLVDVAQSTRPQLQTAGGVPVPDANRLLPD